MKAIISFSMLILLIVSNAYAQNPVAVFMFEDAEAAFANKDYQTTLSKLEEAEKELGNVNPPILYLRIMARNELIKAETTLDFDKVEQLRADCARYLREYGGIEKVRDQAREVYRVQTELKKYPATRLAFTEEAAQRGNIAAIFYLGNLYYHGQGVSQDYATAITWFKKAAQNGHAGAMNSLGACYYGGQGVTQNYITAREWYEKAVENGNLNGMFNLGLLYHYGKGVPIDYATAKIWYENAANSGLIDAMKMLVELYNEGGYGLEMDQALSEAWLKKADAAEKENEEKNNKK